MSAITHLRTDHPPVDEAHLVIQARVDAEAFAELYRRHVARVYRYHIAHTGNSKDAEDLTSQTFMAALESIRSYRGSGSFAAWLMGIARHKRLMFFRSRVRLELPLEAADDLPDLAAHADVSVAQSLDLDQLRLALAHLSPDRAEAITLCFFGGLKPEEAGCVLGKSREAVKMLLSRGLRDLRARTSLALEAQDER